MKIGIISDTHSLDVPAKVLKAFEDVDFIIHAGDFCTLQDTKQFSELKEVKAVHGNMDDTQVHDRFPEEIIFEHEGFRFGVTHGEGPAKRVIDFVKERFKNKKLDVVIFGHSHHPLNEVIDGTLYFNPGSPNDTVVAPYCSYGILTVKEGKIVGSIIKV